MIGAAELALLPDHATVINTARGVRPGLRRPGRGVRPGRLFAILDVTDPSRCRATSPLYDLPNVMVTPHIAGSLGTEIQRLSDHALDELDPLDLSGEPLRAEITPTSSPSAPEP